VPDATHISQVAMHPTIAAVRAARDLKGTVMKKPIRIVRQKQITEGERELLIELLGLKLPQRLTAQIERALDLQMLPIPELPADVVEICERDPSFDSSSLIETALTLFTGMMVLKLKQDTEQRCPMCEGRGNVPKREREPDLSFLKDKGLEQIMLQIMIGVIKKFS
jgi:hypothetical protein